MKIDVFQAVRRNDSNLKAILDGLKDINIRDEDDQNLLHEAIAYGKLEIGLDLIRRGIDVNMQNNDGQTPLHYAGIHQNPEIAHAILSNGGDMSVLDLHGNSPLWSAVFNAKGQYDTVKVFANFNSASVAQIKNKHGRSPIDFAKQIGNLYLANLISDIQQ